MTIGNGISFSGIASGLDTRAIIDQLMALERLPIQALEGERDEAGAKLDLVDTFGNLVKDLQEQAKVLADSSKFFALSATSSHEGIANVTASGGAEPGSHSILVESTASIDRWAFDGVADLDRNLATGAGQTVRFDVNGQSYSVAIDEQNSTITDVMNAIEAAAGEDIDASVVNSGTTENPSYQLVLASRSSGSAYRISNLSTDVGGLGLTPDTANITVGGDAVATIDGLRISRSTNDFSDVLEGVSIDLIAASETEMTVSVESDREVVRTQVDEFLTAYNEVVSFVNAQSTYSEEGGAGGLLFGDSILSSVQRELRSAFEVPTDTVVNDTEGYSTLSLVGIKLQSNGTLQLDETVFNEKMNTNLQALADLFVDYDGFDNAGAAPDDPNFTVDTTADDGLADNLVRTIERMFGTYEGGIRDPQTQERIVLDSLFKAREESINDTIRRLEDQIDGKERRLESYEAGLIRQYAALEELLGGLNAQGAALGSALSSLPSPQR